MRRKYENHEMMYDAGLLFNLDKDENMISKGIIKEGITGSDIAKIAMEDSNGKALEVFNEKLGGGIPLVEDSRGIYTKRMKPIIKEWLERDFLAFENNRIKIFDYPYILKNNLESGFISLFDGIGVVESDYKYLDNRESGELKYIPKRDPFGIRIETLSELEREKWDKGIPREDYLKCQWDMGVTGLYYFLMVYLIGSDVKWIVVRKDDKEINALKNKGSIFIRKYLECKLPPPINGIEIEEDTNYIPLDEVKIRDNKIKRFRELDLEIKELKKKKDKIKQDLFMDMGESKRATDGEFFVRRCVQKKIILDTNHIKEKYPNVYKDSIKSSNEYVNMRVSKVE